MKRANVGKPHSLTDTLLSTPPEDGISTFHTNIN